MTKMKKFTKIGKKKSNNEKEKIFSPFATIGVSDKTRRIEGVDGNEARLNDLLRVPYDFCNPSVKVRCEYLPCTDSEGRENRILLMTIPASSQLHTNQADECFMRVGDKSKKLEFIMLSKITR